MTEKALREIVETVINATYAKAKEVYGREFDLPVFEFDVSGRVAGRAFLQLNLIKFNPVLMEQNLDRFVKRTVPHECAHLIEWALYKYGGHGWTWQKVMKDLGVEDNSQCHSYDTSGSNRKALNQWKVNRYE